MGRLVAVQFSSRAVQKPQRHIATRYPYMSTVISAVFTCIGALGTPSRTGPLARKYLGLPGFPYS